MKRALLVAVLAIAIVLASVAVATAGPLSGTIFTTVKDGTVVNGNTKYQAKEDVYLDGGPGPNAPAGAAGLPPGDYYFQVTDPAGKTLLSVDPITSRKVRVNSYGVIDYIYPASTLTKFQGKWYGTHLSGTDADHGAAPWNAITVQLMPYLDTPNNGGVYKVWMTPVDKYAEGEGKFGFIPSWSKTDNFKVKNVKFVPPTVKVRKFHDHNCNGIRDVGDEELFDWTATYVDPLGTPFSAQTMPFLVDNAMPEGTWTFTEQMKSGWFQTAAIVDGVTKPLDLTASVVVGTASGETHEIWFGNCELGSAEAFKYLDHNLNGSYDEGEAALDDVVFNLEGTDCFGNHVGPLSATTGTDGKATWANLLPGSYTITETVPTGSFATTPVTQNVTVQPDGVAKASFGNARYISVSGSKFYDRNGNGVWDADEVAIPGWKVVLTGTDYLGNAVGPDVQFTGSDGSYTWENLLPGDYTVTEVMPVEACWMASTAISYTATVDEGSSFEVYFGNYCKTYVDFNTKGFWHNKNGLAILAEHPEWIAYVNTLAPYSGNPFDGKNPDGSDVPAAKNVAGETIAAEGTALAEISNFLVDANSDYQQLEQQLATFIFNVKATNASVIVGPEGPVSSGAMIDDAIGAWDTGVEVQYWAGILDGYNNNDAVPIVCPEPPSFSY